MDIQGRGGANFGALLWFSWFSWIFLGEVLGFFIDFWFFLCIFVLFSGSCPFFYQVFLVFFWFFPCVLAYWGRGVANFGVILCVPWFTLDLLVFSKDFVGIFCE